MVCFPRETRRDEGFAGSLGALPYDWIGLLAEIGWECAGAVRVFEHGRERTCELRLEEIPSSELAERAFERYGASFRKLRAGCFACR